jgi:AbrB family looped-hinge helix DNA binding protein
MGIAQSKVTAQGQISIPARIRQKLGIVPGSVLEWDEDGENIVIRRAGQYSLDAIRREVFPGGVPAKKTDKELKQGIRSYVKKRYARH